MDDAAYGAAAWTPYYQAVVAAAAALLGLLVVAVTFNLAQVVDSAKHRARAREALGQLLVLVLLGVLVLIPGQTRRQLGAELIVYGVIVSGVTIRLQYNTVRRLPTSERAAWLMRDMTYNVGVVAILLAGIGLVAHALGGLYWLVPAVVIFFVWSSLNAWLLLVLDRNA